MSMFLFSIIFLWTNSIDNNSNEQRQNTKISINIVIQDSNFLFTGWYYVSNTANGYNRPLNKSDSTYFIDPKPIVTAKHASSLEIYESHLYGKTYFGLTMRLNKKGTEIWSYATRKAEITDTHLAFILDNKLLFVSKVNSQITNGVTTINRGDYSRQELESFKTIIENEK